MLHNKNNIEQHIHWKGNSDNCSFWRDNWFCEGQLAQFSTNSHKFDNRKVADFRVDGQGNYHMLIK